LYEEERSIIVDACRWLSRHGYFGSRRGAGGNVSIRVDEGVMAITPSSIPYQDLAQEDICIVSLDGKPVEVREGRKPSIEKVLHARVYQIRSETRALIHTHQTYASVLSILNLSIPPLFDEVVMELGEVVEVIPYARSGSEALAWKAQSKLSNGAYAYLLQNHGALILGETMEKALIKAELLEKVAQVYLLALSTGRPIHTIPS